MDIEVTQSGVEATQQRVPRRGLLAAGIGGAALSLLPFLSGRAEASATTDANASTTSGSTTTSAPPRRPTDDDTALLVFAQQMELTAEGLYRQAIDAITDWTPEQATVMTTLRQSHLSFGNSLSGLLGKSAPSTRSEELFNAWKSKFTGSTDDVLKAASDLESAAVATHLDILAKLQGINGAGLIASIQISEARHTTALRDLAGVTDLTELLVDTEADSLLGNA